MAEEPSSPPCSRLRVLRAAAVNCLCPTESKLLWVDGILPHASHCSHTWSLCLPVCDEFICSSFHSSFLTLTRARAGVEGSLDYNLVRKHHIYNLPSADFSDQWKYFWLSCRLSDRKTSNSPIMALISLTWCLYYEIHSIQDLHWFSYHITLHLSCAIQFKVNGCISFLPLNLIPCGSTFWFHFSIQTWQKSISILHFDLTVFTSPAYKWLTVMKINPSSFLAF